MNNFENAKHLLKGKILTNVKEIEDIKAKVDALLKEKEELELICQEIQEAIKKLSE